MKKLRDIMLLFIFCENIMFLELRKIGLKLELKYNEYRVGKPKWLVL